MEQIQQLLEILKETPQMALWGLGLFFVFTLLKLASWIFALKVVFQQAIKRFFDYKDKITKLKELDFELEKEKLRFSDAEEILSYFEKRKISSVNKIKLIRLLDSLVKKDMNYIFESEIDNAINLVLNSRK